MRDTKRLRQQLSQGELDSQLHTLYGQDCSIKACRERWLDAIAGYEREFGPAGAISIFSAPGRSELGGNHTDHQHGRVLACAVNLDVVAVAVPNKSGMIRVLSQGHTIDVIDLARTTPLSEEKNHSASLIRGIASHFLSKGYPVTGFDAYTTSNVLKGSGLSSSAAFEVLIGTILNHFFAQDALSPIELAQIGQHAENVFFGKPCGLMDQMASSVGGVIAIDFEQTAIPQINQIAFDLSKNNYTLCIVDSGADHSDLTDEYAAITQELAEICAHFGKRTLREVKEEDFFAALPALRALAGDRAVLRGIHIYEDNRRVQEQTKALAQQDFPRFLALVNESGLSSWTQLQNVVPTGATAHQEVALTLSLCRRLLAGQGACRVHGGGFAGTVQAYVPNEQIDTFVTEIEKVLGAGHCHRMVIRPCGGFILPN